MEDETEIAKSNPNTRKLARDGQPYKKIKRPKTTAGIVYGLDVWMHYLRAWGQRVGDEFHKAGTPGEKPPARIAGHLDPPDDPWSDV